MRMIFLSTSFLFQESLIFLYLYFPPLTKKKVNSMQHLLCVYISYTTLYFSGLTSLMAERKVRRCPGSVSGSIPWPKLAI